MTSKLPSLSVPDLARVQGETPKKAAEWIIDHYNHPGASFNYVRGTRVIKAAYRGLHNIHQLKIACNPEPTDVGRKSNTELVEVASPLVFGRKTQVFDLTARKFSFGHRRAGFRVPFFFVEDGQVKIYYVWPRKNSGLTTDQIGMIATIYKYYLLDTEFFGIPSDIEFVDASVPCAGCKRTAKQYSLSNIELWQEERLSRRLTLISHAIDLAEASGKIQPRKRKQPRQAADMPLFF